MPNASVAGNVWNQASTVSLSESKLRFRVWHLLAALTLASLLLTYWHLWGDDIVEDIRNVGPPRNPNPQVQQSLDRLDEVIKRGPAVKRSPSDWKELAESPSRSGEADPEKEAATQ